MGNVAIQVQDLSKRYFIGGQQDSYRTFREAIADAATAPLRRASKLLRGQATGAAELDEEIWALRDVSFSVQHGEVMGIIGHNGAGKSTLLKILSRITEPTAGRIDLYGRVGALLEVGTGFHSELTGRENIYLNGSILGMRRAEIAQKFDEIVDFAGVEKFIDTPVKHYSTGMRLRLGFAVAAHLEPEILVVDEVLAVGDAEFQKKCIGKMKDVAGEGRTVLFVSHNMDAVQTLCPRTILLNHGCVEIDDETHKTIVSYLAHQKAKLDLGQGLVDIPRPNADLGQIAKLTDIALLDANGQNTNTFAFGEPFTIKLSCEFYHAMTENTFLVGIDTIYGQRILTITSLEADQTFAAQPGEHFMATLEIRDVLLKPGVYYLSLALFSTNVGVDYLPQALTIEISDAAHYHRHISQVTVGFLQIPNPVWQIEEQA